MKAWGTHIITHQNHTLGFSTILLFRFCFCLFLLCCLISIFVLWTFEHQGRTDRLLCHPCCCRGSTHFVWGSQVTIGAFRPLSQFTNAFRKTLVVSKMVEQIDGTFVRFIISSSKLNDSWLVFVIAQASFSCGGFGGFVRGADCRNWLTCSEQLFELHVNIGTKSMVPSNTTCF